MFSLIISIIAIALVAALALASIYYGGAAFQEGSADAEASTVINQGQQVAAAVTMADVNGEWTALSTQEDLKGEYLKEVPQIDSTAWVVAVASTKATVANLSEEVCLILNEKSGQDIDAVDFTIPTDADTLDTQFGCTGTAGAYVGFYKF